MYIQIDQEGCARPTSVMHGDPPHASPGASTGPCSIEIARLERCTLTLQLRHPLLGHFSVISPAREAVQTGTVPIFPARAGFAEIASRTIMKACPNITTLVDLWLQLGSRTAPKLSSHAREST